MLGNSDSIAGLIVATLIIGGGITLSVIYPTSDKISFYVVVIAIVLSPLLVVAAYFVNKQKTPEQP